MTSSINPNNIDGTYPIAGQDNDSQGFRDNFTNIKNNFTFAYNELTDLQSKAIVKSPLSGSSVTNDMNYTQLIAPQLLKTVETVNNLGTKTGSFTISWADAHYQYFTTSGNTTLAFSNWPTSGFWTKLRLEITTDAADRTVTLPTAVSVNLENIRGANAQVITLPTIGKYCYELTTVDAGATIKIQDVTQVQASTLNYVQITSTANAAVNVNPGIQQVLISPQGPVVSRFVDITMPNVAVDGYTVDISSNSAVQFTRVLAPWVQTVDSGANVALAAGQGIRYMYQATEKKWYKLQLS